LPALIIEGGERTKNSYFHVSEIHSHIDRYHIDRHSYVLAVGGGALLDMVGLAASTAHRGVRHVRIPTTTLSQADSGVGVKNGINAFGKKNFIGTFTPPFAVVNDFDLLNSLSPRDKRAGYVEAVKVALIRNREFFESIERDAAPLSEFEPDAMQRSFIAAPNCISIISPLPAIPLNLAPPARSTSVTGPPTSSSNSRNTKSATARPSPSASRSMSFTRGKWVSSTLPPPNASSRFWKNSASSFTRTSFSTPIPTLPARS